MHGGLGEERAIAGRLPRSQRSPERLQAELANKPVTARDIAWRRRLAWHQSLRVAVAKCRRGKLFARDRVGFGQDRRNALTLRLIGEAVEIVLLRKLVGGTREIAEKIANRVVVLAMREPADRGGRSGYAIGLQPRQGRIQIGRSQLGEVGDPRLER